MISGFGVEVCGGLHQIQKQSRAVKTVSLGLRIPRFKSQPHHLRQAIYFLSALVLIIDK